MIAPQPAHPERRPIQAAAPARRIEPRLTVRPDQRAVYVAALDALTAAGVRYAVGGGLALALYGDVRRPVHDLDLHILPADVSRAREALDRAGFDTTLKHVQWLAQAHREGCQVCLIFGDGAWDAAVDGAFFQRAAPGFLWQRPVLYAPADELIFTKAMTCGRTRFDGADLYHLLIGLGEQVDWDAVLRRFGPHWEVLLAQLVLFGYVFPSHAHLVPHHVWDALLARREAARQQAPPSPSICRGTFLDGSGSYARDVGELGYCDARREHWERRLRTEPSHPKTAQPPS